LINGVLFSDIIIIKYEFYNSTSKAEKKIAVSFITLHRWRKKIAVCQNYEDRRKERSLIALAFRYM